MTSEKLATFTMKVIAYYSTMINNCDAHKIIKVRYHATIESIMNE